jgi:nitroreductase
MVSPSLSGQDEPPTPEAVYNSVLAYAIRAPSLLNSQPWHVEIAEGQMMRLWIDRERMFPALDPTNRQMLLSHATFLENLDIAASHLGYSTSIDYFPLGWGTDATIHEFPVAQVEYTPSPGREQDPLFSCLNTRQTCRGPFERTPLDKDSLMSISGSFESEFTSFVALTDPETCEKIGDLVGRSLKTALEREERREEWIRMVRFDDRETDLSRDGIGLSHMGGGESILSAIRGTRVSREKVNRDPSLFSNYLLERCSEQVRAVGGYGWISTKGKSRLNQIHAGRALERAWLQATARNIGFQPYHHVLGDYAEMAGIQEELKDLLGVSGSHTLQAFFRLGYAVPGKTLTPRRSPASFVSSPAGR